MSVILLLSAALCSAAICVALLLWRQVRDWRVGFLAAMAGLMAARQIWALWNHWADHEHGGALHLHLTKLDELPSLAASILMLAVIVIVGRMIKERDRSADELQENQIRIRDFIEASSDRYWEMDSDLRFSFLADPIDPERSPTVTDAIGRTRWDLVGADLEAEPWRSHKAVLEAHKPFRDFTYSSARADGTLTWWRVSGKPMFDRDGSFAGYRGTAADVSSELQAQREQKTVLEESERRFRNFAEAASDWFWETDAQLRFSYISGRFQEITGVDPAAFIGKRRSDVGTRRNDPDAWEMHCRRLRAHMPFHDFVYDLELADGRHFMFKTSGKPIFDKYGRFVGYRGTARDVTVEEAATRAQMRLAKAIEVIPAAVALFDANDRLIICNQEYKDIYETPAAPIVPGVTFEQLVRAFAGDDGIAGSQEEGDTWVTRRLDRRRQPARNYEYQRRPDRWTEVSDYVLDDGSVVTVGQDVTDRKQAEASAERSRHLLESVIEGMSDGVAVFDQDERLVLWNERYEAYYPKMADLLHPGTDFWALPDACGSRGQIVRCADQDEAEDFALYRKEAFRKREVARYLTSEGRWLETRDYVADGIAHMTFHIDVTEQQQFQTALGESERRYRSLYNGSPVMMHSVDRSGRLISVNNYWLETLGYDREDVIGRPMIDFLTEESKRRALEEAIPTFFRRGVVRDEPFRIIRHDGEIRDVLLTSFAERDASGEIVSSLSVMVDVTERNAAERALRLRNRALDASANGIIISDAKKPDQPIVYVNPAFERITGYSQEEAIGRNCRFLQGTEHHQPQLDELRDILQDKKDGRVVLRNYRKDGRPFWNELHLAPVRDEDGTVTHFVGVQNDITDLIQAKERAVREKDRAEEYLEIAEAVIVELDEAGRVRMINRQGCKVLGFEERELIGKDWFETAIPDDQRAALRARFEAAMTRQKAPSDHFENEVLTASGRRRYITWRNRYCFAASGKGSYVLSSGLDVTELKQAEREAARAQQQLTDAIESLTEGFALYDAHDRLVVCNERYRDTYQESRDILVEGVRFQDHISRSAFRGEIADAVGREEDWIRQRLQQHEEPIGAFEQRLGNGRWLLVSEQRTSDGGYVGVRTDITDRKKAEEAAREHQAELAKILRLSTMGEMASALAHELNQPIAAIYNYSQGCLRRAESESLSEPELTGALEQVSKQAERASAIVRNISGFIVRGEPKRAPMELNQLVRGVVELAGPELAQGHVELALELAPGLLEVPVDKIEIEQALLNLVRNAIDAMRAIPAEQRTLTIQTAQKAETGSVAIVVSDSGPGLPAGQAEQIFNPFFSTKEGGMGMGLAITRTILEAHGGSISVEPDCQSGAAFHICLPVETDVQADAA